MSHNDFAAIEAGDKVAWIIGRIEYAASERTGIQGWTNITLCWDHVRKEFVPYKEWNDAE